MELEVGMYARTLNGIIKVDKIQNDVMKDTKGYLHYGDFIRASNNIIDLIEIGDVLHAKSDDEYWTVQKHLYTKGECICTEWKVIESEEQFLEEIDEIITKEQLKNVSYKVD